jgi:haloacetate dehalogenase
MFQGYQSGRIATSGAEITFARGGEGPPLLLLHGYPQTHVCWHRIAEPLAERFTVVAADLRGYGDSAKPRGGGDHAVYSKRAMALDQVELMAALGFEQFQVAGHDRGGRVAHRMALDHPERVSRLALLDIVPTRDMYRMADRRFAEAYFHWFFLIQPEDLPERLIGGASEHYLRRMLGAWGSRAGIISPEAMAEYLRCGSDPAAIHAACEDYRAAATIDLVHDEADLDRKIVCPLLILWGRRGVVGRLYDVPALWQARAVEVESGAFDCGHFLPEEAPQETLAAFLRFLSG